MTLSSSTLTIKKQTNRPSGKEPLTPSLPLPLLFPSLSLSLSPIKGFLNQVFFYQVVSLPAYYGWHEVDMEALSHPMAQD